MEALFHTISSIFGFIIDMFLLIPRYFQLAIDAFAYFVTAVNFLPLYMKAFAMAFLAITVALFVINLLK